jgi:hypothetical protein
LPAEVEEQDVMPAETGEAAVHPFIPYEELPARQRRRIVIGASLRTIATIIVVVAIYFLIPMDRAITATTVVEMVIGVLAQSAAFGVHLSRTSLS